MPSSIAVWRCICAARIQRHLQRHGVDLRHWVGKTDNGGEFVGGHDPQGPSTALPAAWDIWEPLLPPYRARQQATAAFFLLFRAAILATFPLAALG